MRFHGPVVDGRSDEDAVAASVALAGGLLVAAAASTTTGERRRSARLGRLLADPAGRALLFTLTDEVLRATGNGRAMARLRDLVGEGLPRSLSALDRLALRAGAAGGRLAPGPVATLVRRRIRGETKGVILPADDPGFGRHLARRAAEGMRTNVNLLGEAILGDDEAEVRLEAICTRLRRPDVDYVSVKISALCANLDVFAFDASVDRIVERLGRVFAVAAEQDPPAFVNLDMEEHRDLELTIAAFRRVLDEARFRALPAGIVLQAYLPDSHAALDELCAWAAQRRAAGGAGIKVRIVKGANLAMERVEAELGGWSQAPYATKAEVDASYKRLLERALVAAEAGDVRVGVASHNLFDVAWALVRRAEQGLEDRVEIEMLEGMAPAQSRATRDEAGGLLLYTPVVESRDMAASIAYLARRLDENAGPDNFLRSLFTITPGSPGWEREQERFVAAVADRDAVGTATRRDQDRPKERRRFDAAAPFANEPDTDLSTPPNRAWALGHLRHDRPADRPPPLTTTAEIDDAVAVAVAAAPAWARTPTLARRKALTRVAEVMAADRGRTLAVMAHETGKTVREGDPEVSEALDFARWAAAGTRTLDALAADGVACHPVGVVVVAGPWNFPYAIPANGVLSALAAGNAVILKPAPEAVATAVELVRHIHGGGVPPAACQLVRCPDDATGRRLITHPDVASVILTGGLDTARKFLDWQPSLRLLAETSGKNALVVTGGADIDLAIRDLVRSAFGHAGQKCSAASLVILTAEVHDDRRLLDRLADAVRSLRVGPADEPSTMVGPLIAEPGEKLARALTRLDPGESWLVEPRRLTGDGRRWSPGVRIGVAPGSWFHRTECFGPVLGVMRARDLDHAIELQNGTDFGLTGGLHSLDPTEIERWLDGVQVGNAYVNRHITGAVVRRQPFGGWKSSSIGPGAKPGGPDDVLRFVRPGVVRERATADGARASHRHWWAVHYGLATDATGLRSERNVLRYLPVRKVVARLGVHATVADVDLLRLAATVTGVSLEVSVPPDALAVLDLVAGRSGSVVETAATLAGRVCATGAERLRRLGPFEEEVARACHRAGIAVDDTPLTGHGRVELPRWLRAQAVSTSSHRHGRVPDDEPAGGSG